MKKLSFAVLIIATTLWSTSCKKDTANKPTNDSIIGTWQLMHYHEVDIDSTTNPITVNTKDTSYTLILKFNSDNSADSYTDTLQSFGNVGGYTLYGNDSISYVFGPPPVKARYTIQGTTLTFFTQPHYLYDSLHYFITTQTYIRLQ